MRPEVTANSTTNSASGSNFDQSDDLTSERIANESSMHQESTESIKDEHDLSSESFKLFETCPDDEQLSQNDCVEEDDDNDFCLVNSALEEDSDHLDEEYDDDDVTDSKLANWEKRKMLEIFTAIQENDVERLIRLSMKV